MLKLFEKIKEDFGMIATLLGFIVDSLAIIALLSQGVTPSLPILGTSAQILIWTLALFSYLGFLRDHWRKSIKQQHDELYDSRFEYYLFSDLPRLRNPYALIGFVFLFFMMIWILSSVSPTEQPPAFIVFIIGLIVLSFVVGNYKEKQDAEIKAWREWESLDDEETLNLWFLRIEKEFKQTGYVVNYDLAVLYSSSPSFVNKVMRKFVDQYGVDYSIYLLTDTVSKQVPLSTDSKQLIPAYRYPLTLTRKDFIESRPWLYNWERFFNDD